MIMVSHVRIITGTQEADTEEVNMPLERQIC